MDVLVQTFNTILSLIIILFGLTNAPLAATPRQSYQRTSTLAQATTSFKSEAFAVDIGEPGFLVRRAVDGDTIELESGEKVRYIGINAPESVDKRRAVQCFGKQAAEYNRQLVENKRVRLVKDVSKTDKYGRLLRYVYLPDGTFVNLKLVEDGYARASTFPPDVKYSKEFAAAEREAREAGAGLWSACR